MKLKKRKKSARFRGKRTHGHSAKLNKGKGSRGGKGMSGSGKRGDQKKTKVNKLYHGNYFGKQGITSKRTKNKKMKFINVGELTGKEKDLQDYKILGDGEVTGKLIIKARAASKSAIEKIKKAGGDIIIKEKRKTDKKKIKEKTEEKKETKKEEKEKTE